MGGCSGCKCNSPFSYDEDSQVDELAVSNKPLHDFLVQHRDKIMDPQKVLRMMVSGLKNFISFHKSDADDFWKEVLKFIVLAVNEELEELKENIEAEVRSAFNKFIESKEAKLRQIVVDYLYDLADRLLTPVLESIMKACFIVQDAQVDIYYFWSFLRAIPIVGTFIPATPTYWDDVLPPNDKFYNWALTVKTNPDDSLVITTQQHIRDMIEHSQKYGKKMRVSTFRHSFSPMFSDDGAYIHGFLLPHDQTDTHLIDTGDDDMVYDPDLKWAHVKDLPETTRVEILEGYKLRVQCGASNMTYSKLANKLREAGKEFPSEPINILQLFQGFCGTHALACHGGGIFRTTVSDYITKLTMLNYKGETVVYEDDDLKKVAAHLGLLGIVTEMELQYEKPYLAMYQPKWKDNDEYFNINGSCAESDFQEDVNESFYNEFFFWPYSTDNKVFVNCWKRNNDTDNFQDCQRIPHSFSKTLQECSEVFMQTINQLVVNFVKSKDSGKGELWYAKFISLLGEKMMRAQREPIMCPSYDALHFQRGIQNMRVFDMEWVFPLKELEDENGEKVLNSEGLTVPDVSLCRELWYCAKSFPSTWKYTDEKGVTHIAPQLLPLEMRIIMGSNVCLSPAHGFPFALYIEVLTPTQTDYPIWNRYCQDLTDAWASIAGTECMRPHWGKLWQDLKIDGKDMTSHLRDVYKEEIAEFNKIREEADPQNVFVNKHLGEIFL